LTVSTLDAERQTIIASEDKKFRTLILRVGKIYGADEHQTRQLISYLRVGRMPIPGSGNNYCSLLHVDDAGLAFALAVETAYRAGSDSTEIINVTDDAPVKTGELLKHLAQLLGARRPIHLPSILIRLYVGSEMARNFAHSIRMHNARAQHLLGFRPRYPTYREGYSAVLTQMGFC